MKHLIHIPTALLLLAAATSSQTTLRVPADHSTIAGAIAAATHGDTVLVSPGTYFEDTLRPHGKRITIRSTDGPAATVIDSQWRGRCFRITDPITNEFVLDGFTLYRGQAPTGGGTIGDGGGGMLIQNGSPVIRNCIFRLCRADSGSPPVGKVNGYRGGHGGAAYVALGQPLFENCQFLNNSSGRGGHGAVGVKGTTGTVVSPPGDGGTGYTGGTGGHGGAVYAESSAPLFVNCHFVDNATGRGGDAGTGGDGGDQGGWAFGKSGDGGRGGNGGRGGTGGALYATGSTPILLNCTVVSNGVGTGGWLGYGGKPGAGINPGSPGGSGSFGAQGSFGGVSSTGGSVANSILWDNVNGEVSVPVVEYSCVEGGATGPGNLSGDPRLAGGGKGPGLLPGSPCIDAGSNAKVPAGVVIDLLGRPRFVDDAVEPNTGTGSGALVDLGATEFVASHVLPFGCGNPAGSLVLESGTPRLGSSLRFAVSHPDAPRRTTLLGSSGAGARAGVILGTASLSSGCGLELRGGYLQVDLGQPHQWIAATGGASGGPARADVTIPNDPTLLGAMFFVQGVVDRLRAPGQPAGSALFTETLQLQVGP